jgi:rhodanese-related sulfurtransferase
MDLKNKFIVSFGIAFSLTIFLFIFLNNSYQKKMGTLDTISLDDWKEIYDNNKDYNVLDVRTQEEFNEGHIENAININFYDTNFKEQINNLDKNKTYLIYCKSGERSYNTLNLMRGSQFIKVYDLEGGIDTWRNSEYKLEK